MAVSTGRKAAALAAALILAFGLLPMSAAAREDGGTLTIAYAIRGVSSLPDGFSVTADYAANGDGGAAPTAAIGGFAKRSDGSFTGSATISDVPSGCYTVCVEHPAIQGYAYESAVETCTVGVTTAGGTAALGAAYGAEDPGKGPKADLLLGVAVKIAGGTDGENALLAAQAEGREYYFFISGMGINGNPILLKPAAVRFGSVCSFSIPCGTYTVSEITDSLNAADALTGYAWEKAGFEGDGSAPSASAADLPGGGKNAAGAEVSVGLTGSGARAAVSAVNFYTRGPAPRAERSVFGP